MIRTLPWPPGDWPCLSVTLPHLPTGSHRQMPAAVRGGSRTNPWMYSIAVCYQVARKDANHFSAQFAGVMMIQGKSYLLDSGRVFSRSGYPSVEMLIRGQAGHWSPREWGPSGLWSKPGVFPRAYCGHCWLF